MKSDSENLKKRGFITKKNINKLQKKPIVSL